MVRIEATIGDDVVWSEDAYIPSGEWSEAGAISLAKEEAKLGGLPETAIQLAEWRVVRTA